jgi:hypothetical protein
MFFECPCQICRILNRGTLGTVVLILQEKKQSHPNKADKNSSKQHRPMPDERVTNSLWACH